MSKFIIFANGKRKHGVMVERVLAHAADARIIAADGGLRIAREYQLTPDAIIGDMDSVNLQQLKELEAEGAAVHPYAAEKDETDLELALLYAAEQGASWIRIIGATGGRFDQTLANVYLLALPELADCDTALVADKQIIRLYRSGTHIIEGTIGDTVSLIPISGDVEGVTTAGLKYPLKDGTLYFGPARGVSNVMQAAQAQIRLKSGYLLCIHTEGTPE